MNHISPIKKTAITAICTALAVVLPIALHSVANAGRVLLPMHLPVLLCGLVCGWPFGLLAGVLGPVLSSLITGMPGAAHLPGMIIELAVYGLVAGLLMRWIRTGKTVVDILLSLLGAMLAGRIAAGLAKALIFAAGEYSFAAWVTAHFVTGLPGILLQLVLLPLVFLALEKARLIPRRYPR